MAQPILSYAPPVDPPRWVRWLARPIGWPFFTLMTLAGLWILWQFRVPFPLLIARNTIFYILSCFSVVWLLRLILSFVVTRIYRLPWHTFAGSLWRYTIPILVGIGVWVCIRYDVPKSVAWRLSEPALRRHVESIIAAEKAMTIGQGRGHPPQWVGLYRIDRLGYVAGDNVVVFSIAGSSAPGFLYFPDGRHALDFGVILAPMEGNWYRVEGYFDP